MKKKDQTLFGCINIFTLAESLNFVDVFCMAGFFIYLAIYSYQVTIIPFKFMVILSLAMLMVILQISAIHGIYNKYFGLIIFNCVIKFLYLVVCFGLLIVAAYEYMIHPTNFNNIAAYQNIITFSFFGICYYGFHAYLLVEMAILLHYGQKKNSKSSLPHYYSNLAQYFRQIRLPRDNNSDQESFVNIDENILQMNQPGDNSTQMNGNTDGTHSLEMHI